MARQSARSIPAKAARGSRQSVSDFKKTSPGDLFWDLLTFDRLMTGPVIHIIYWAGLLLLVLGGFGAVGAAIGAAMHEDGVNAFLLAAPLLVGGVLVLVAGALIWRAFCEFFVAVFRISDDLRAMRAQMESGVPLAASETTSAGAEAPKSTTRGRKAGV